MCISGMIHTDVCTKSTPPEKKTGGKSIIENTRSGAGEQSLLQERRAKAHKRNVWFADTGTIYISSLALFVYVCCEIRLSKNL